MTILHISADYPDAFNRQKTTAIKNLVEATAKQHDHYVYSLNRVDISPAEAVFKRPNLSNQHWSVDHIKSQGHVSCWTYQSPSRGLFLKASMLAIADRIAEDIVKRNLRPKLIHGHKLSIEGIAAYHVAQKLKIPFALTIQGNSDRTIARIRRDLAPLYRQIFHKAAVVFPFAPWALEYMECRFGRRRGPTVMLPCITAQEKIISPRKTKNRVVSAFHLKHWQLKNLPALVRSADYIGNKASDFELTILGGGSDADFAAARSYVDSSVCHNIELAGAIEPNMIQKEMNNSAGFAMLSHKESYGMVFIEAMLAGCPVVYPKGAAIDGYFEGHDFAMAAPAREQMAINDAILKLVRDQDRLKGLLAKWQESGAAAAFQKAEIAKNYSAGLKAAMQGGGGNA